jgi:hypothetical protein
MRDFSREQPAQAGGNFRSAHVGLPRGLRMKDGDDD